MLKTITTSDLRTHVKRVLNEVGYGGVQLDLGEYEGIRIVSPHQFAEILSL